MKRSLLYLILLAAFAIPSQATHLMGGEVTATHIGGYDYEVHLVTYRDTLGIPMQTWATFEVLDTMGVSLFDSTTSVDTTSGALMPLFPYGVEVYHFYDTITMPGPGHYTIGWTNCCRNGAIINAASPLSEAMYLYTSLTVYDTAIAVNSSPEFLNEPVVFMPVGMPWSYNPLPFDPDGDSLSWSLTVPLDWWGDSIDGYYLPPGDTLDPFSIDPITGTITWTPILEGNFVTSIAIDEYRGGQWIGRMVRDMQMIVVASDDSLARFANLDDEVGTNSDGYYWERLNTNELYTLRLLGTDPDLGDVLRMNAVGEPFLLENNPAEFFYTPTGTNNDIEGTFFWTPLNEHARVEDYIVVFRLDDGIFATDQAVLFRVDGVTGISSVDAPDFGAILFPNPSQGFATIRIKLDQAEKASINVYDLQGKLLYREAAQNFAAGTHDVILKTDLTSGQYLIAIDGRTHQQVLPMTVAE
jgi:hypothetical protein